MWSKLEIPITSIVDLSNCVKFEEGFTNENRKDWVYRYEGVMKTALCGKFFFFTI